MVLTDIDPGKGEVRKLTAYPMVVLPTGRKLLVERHIVKCDEDGVFANAFTISRKQHSGQYTLVAYTQWMRNFGADSFFYKPLLIINPNENGNDHEFHELTRKDGRVDTADSLLKAYQRGNYIYIPTPTHLTPTPSPKARGE